MQTLCSVPAKLILSGEHAVLYDCPALSLAIELDTICECHFTQSETNLVTIELSDFSEIHSFPHEIWHRLATDIESRYHLFEKDTLAIQSVLTKPVDLVLTTLHHFESMHSMKAGNWHLKIHSQIPASRGLGSSASVIISILKSLYQQHEIDVDNGTLQALAQRVEARQHGQSSGIDPATIINGGLLEYQTQQPIKRHEQHELKAWLIDTGLPQSTTGQTVSHVRQNHADDAQIWKQFKATTQKIIQAWDIQDSQKFLEGIQYNQKLLETIGVVPAKVRNFIAALQQIDAIAKVCGAGSIDGDNAGVIICFNENSPQKICEEFGYSYQAITINNQGALCREL